MNADDLRRIRASAGWREQRIEIFRDTSRGAVLVKGQRPARGPWRYAVLNGVARAVGLPMLRAVPAPGGPESQRIEVARLRALAAAGAHVPEVLHVGDDFFVQRYFDGPLLFELLRDGGAPAIRWWRRGARALAELHATQQYLSQAFTRNMIADGDRLAMIDFDDDPLQVMPLAQAQARDWLAYLYTSAMSPPGPLAAMAEILRRALEKESPAVRRQLRQAASRMSRLLPRRHQTAARGLRRYLAMLQTMASLMSAAQLPADHRIEASQRETHHARHH